MLVRAQSTPTDRPPRTYSAALRRIGPSTFVSRCLRNIIRGKLNGHFQDLPVFNGKYSTTCYLDETQHALDDMSRRMGRDAPEVLPRARSDLHAPPLSPYAPNSRYAHELPVRPAPTTAPAG